MSAATPTGLDLIVEYARSVAYVVATLPEAREWSDDLVVSLACRLAGAPPCFDPITAARWRILTAYRERLGELGGRTPAA